MRASTLLLTVLALAALSDLGTAQQKKSLVIALDGLRADGIENAITPNLDRLIQGEFGDGAYQGAYAYYGQTIKDGVTYSGPNHASIMTGVTVAKHGVTSNSNISAGNFAQYPHYLRRLEDATNDALNTAYLFTWADDRFISSGADFERDGTDFSNTRLGESILSGEPSPYSEATATTGIDALFIFYDDIDRVGHESGFSPGNSAYLTEIRQTDLFIGRLLSAVESRPSFADEDWQIVVTSDHGGRGWSHGFPTADNYTIPYIVTSKSAQQGLLTGTPRNVDVAPTVLDHMGFAVPGDLDGRIQGHSVQPDHGASLTSDLIAYLQFEGNYNDTSGSRHVNHGTAGGVGPTLRPKGGKFGGYVDIQNNGMGRDPEFVSLGRPSDLDFGTSTDFSFSLWYRTTRPQSGDPVILGNKGSTDFGSPGLVLSANVGFGNSVGLHVASDRSHRHEIDLIDVGIGGWWFLAATFDRESNAILYAGSPDGTMYILSDHISDVGDISSDLPLNIGQNGTGNHFHNLDADIDDLAIWNRALTLDELRRLYDGGRGVELATLMGLQAGDANQDFQFDQRDLVQVLSAGKYLTGQAATWGEGDWDGAPGGTPGLPPKGDGLFDGSDIVAALEQGHYLSGPYTAIPSREAPLHTPIPEPSTLVLALMSAVGLNAFVRREKKGPDGMLRRPGPVNCQLPPKQACGC